MKARRGHIRVTEIDEFLTDWMDAERSGDTSSLERLLTDDFLGVGPLGFVLPKDAWLARFAGGLAYKSFELEEIQSRLHGDAAVITARQVGPGTLQGSPLPFAAVRATITAIRSPERWLMAGIHMSFIAGTPGAPAVPSMPGRPAITKEEKEDRG
jgi:ketosteroid isomerase-like protein